jgi:hypothetical protein
LTYAAGELVVKDPVGFVPLQARPWWVTESLVDDAIWSSDRALEWLAGGRAATVIRQPELARRADLKESTGPRYVVPDFAVVPDQDDEPVCLVELESDGQGKANKQLKAQLKFGKTHGHFGDDELVVLLGVDTRKTWEEADRDEGGEHHRQAYWHLARAADDESALWLVLGAGPSKGFSPKASTPGWRTHHHADEIFLNVDISELPIPVLGPKGLVEATVFRLLLHTEAESKARGDRPTCCHPGYMMKFARHWLADLAKHLASTDLEQRVGDWSWRLDYGTGRGNTANKAQLYLHFDGSHNADAVMMPLAVALTEFWERKPFKERWAQQVAEAAKLHREAKKLQRAAKSRGGEG